MSPQMLPYHVMQSDKKEILPETEEKLSFRNIYKKKAQHNLVTSNHEQTFFYFLGTAAVGGNYVSTAVTERHQTHK